MIIKVEDKHVVQKCACGAEHEVQYEDIKYKAGNLKQFKFPVCSACKSRIEFIFLTEAMSSEETQLLIKMTQLGLMG